MEMGSNDNNKICIVETDIISMPPDHLPTINLNTTEFKTREP